MMGFSNRLILFGVVVMSLAMAPWSHAGDRSDAASDSKNGASSKIEASVAAGTAMGVTNVTLKALGKKAIARVGEETVEGKAIARRLPWLNSAVTIGAGVLTYLSLQRMMGEDQKIAEQKQKATFEDDQKHFFDHPYQYKPIKAGNAD